MADGYLPLGGGNDRSFRGVFIAPLFQDFEITRSLGHPSRFSATGMRYSSFLSGDDGNRDDDFEMDLSYSDDDDDILSYLPSGGRDMQPKTKAMLRRVTRRYVYGDNMGDSPVGLSEILGAIDAEYKTYELPVAIANQTFSVRTTGNKNYEDTAKILSFAAILRIPEEITLLLFGEESDTESPVAEGRAAFDRVGWTGVRFARGVTIRLQRRLLPSLKRYSPISRAWMTNRNTRAAQRMVQEASLVRAPAQQLMSKEEFLASVDQELSATKPRSPRQMLEDALLFFPRRRKSMQTARKAVEGTSLRIFRYSGDALFSHLVLTCLWSTFGLLLCWQRIPQSSFFSPYTGYISASLIRFARAISILARGSRLWRIGLSVALAPLSEIVLRRCRDRLQVSMVKTVAILCILMLGFTTSTWCLFLFADVTLSRVLSL